MDDTQCHGLLFHIFCFSVLWTPSRSQHLYQSGCDSEHDTLYRSCKEKALETNIQRLEEQNKILLLGLRDIELRNIKYAAVYNDILKLYGSKIVPNGNYVIILYILHNIQSCNLFYDVNVRKAKTIFNFSYAFAYLSIHYAKGRPLSLHYHVLEEDSQIKTTSQTNAKLKKKYVHVYEHELL